MARQFTLGFALLSLVATSSLVACQSPDPAAVGEAAPASLAASPDALVEDHEAGSIVWSVSSAGEVRAQVLDGEGVPVGDAASGTLSLKAKEGEAKTVPLALNAKSGELVAAAPALEGDLTEIGYTLVVKDQPWSGTLHVPKGGTAELAASAKASADAPEALAGPHGGVVQLVGGERYELVADEKSGEVRVYLLDAEGEILELEDRRVTVAVVADEPEVVVLVPDDERVHASGRWRTRVDPLRITLAVRRAGVTRVAIVGFRPGARLVVHSRAPRVKVRVKSAFNGPKIHVKGHGHGPQVHVKVDGSKGKAKAKGHGNGKVSVKVK